MERERNTAFILVLSALVLLLLLAYVTGYCWLGERKEFGLLEPIPGSLGKPYLVERCYEREWQAAIYKPAAAVETWLTGVHVGTVAPTY